MRKRILNLFCFILISVISLAQGNVYNYKLNIRSVVDDKLQVLLTPPAITTDEVVFYMPKIVPGTYDIYDFGRFVSDFKARDAQGNLLTVDHSDVNAWKIKNARSLAAIEYWVEDTWDTEIKENFVFEPGGTNIQDGKNFMINTHGFFGYFDGMKTMSFKITVTKPQGFFGATGMTDVSFASTTDIFTAENYNHLVDSPIMYTMPDTATINVGGAKVLISVFSPNKKVSGKFLASKLDEMLNAQMKYLGGKLPVEKYAFLIYLTDKTGGSGASGALEHSYSSLYFLMEQEEEKIVQMIRDVASHEFFHIVTPLNIHSEEIGNFDFNNPQMSQHLWMYEGCTEYAAGHMQVMYGLISKEEYLDMLREKLYGAEQFKDDLPFTEMSKGCLGEHSKQYSNVYLKGALIGMCLDIKLRSLSGGKYGIQNLMRDLAKTYGKNKSFKDDELFAKITELTYPEIAEFFKKYVSGPNPLPIKEMFEMVGVTYIDKVTVQAYSFGGFDIGYNTDNGQFVVAGTQTMDDFGKKLGFMEGDEIVSWNGEKLTINNIKKVIGGFLGNAENVKKLKVVIMRPTKNGKYKKMTLKSKVFKVNVSEKHVISLNEKATDAQLKLRNAWLQPQ
jgi:predicted metalloprotease with PDZ domain